MANDWKERLGVVFSTNPDFQYTSSDVCNAATPPPSAQDLRVWRDTHQRAGKVVTVVRGFQGSTEELQALARQLKSKCGVGGTAKEGEIIIQGDHRDRIVQLLVQSGYRCKKAGG